MLNSTEGRARTAFEAAFPGPVAVSARAPGRVELLGNHTDYNRGLVMAAAIDRFTSVVGAVRPGREARARTADLGQTDSFALDQIERGEAGEWTRYVRGVVWAMQERNGPMTSGFDLAMAGNVPIGAGLSSSASVQAAVALGLLRLGVVGQGASADLDDAARMDLAGILQKSENQFVGVGSGLLDQFSVLFGRRDHALLLDCRSLAYERLSLGNPAPAIVVCDSKTARKLADGMYNTRRDECERVVTFYRDRKGPEAVRWLRDVTLDELQTDWDRLDPIGRLRARHVLTENDRVRRGAEALKRGDVTELGRLMTLSHASSRDDFANSSPALDALVESAEASPGMLGGKLSGAGWAGCTVNLVEADKSEHFAESVRTLHARRTGVEPTIHVCHAADGASATRSQ